MRTIAAALPKVPQTCSPPKKKLFLTDGYELPLTGLCIYMFRINMTKQLPEEGFQKVFILFEFFFINVATEYIII